MPESYTSSYAIPVAGFESKKAAQLCAFFALKSERNVIDKLKLIKLVYLTERKFVTEHHIPMLYDELYSLPHGPICSGTLNGIDGVVHQSVWMQFINRNGNEVIPTRRFKSEDLDELSEAEIETALSIWSEFGGMTASGIRNWSHLHCPEYTETDKQRIPIRYGDILDAVGQGSEAEVINQEVRDIRRAESILAG